MRIRWWCEACNSEPEVVTTTATPFTHRWTFTVYCHRKLVQLMLDETTLVGHPIRIGVFTGEPESPPPNTVQGPP